MDAPTPNQSEPTPDLTQVLDEAMELHQRGELDQAEALYQGILALAPNHFSATQLLGVVQNQRGDFAAGARLLQAALRLNPRSAMTHLNLGNALWNLQRPEEALASFHYALLFKPDNPEARLNHSLVLQELNRPEEALGGFERVLALQPDHPVALLNQGIALLGLQRYQEAIEVFNRVLTLHPDQAEALAHRASALQRSDRFEEALADFERALLLEPDRFDALVNRAVMLHKLARHQEALASLEQALTIRPGFPEALLNRGLVLLDLHRAEEALACFDEVLILEADHVHALLSRGRALPELQRATEALASYERVLALHPADVEALVECGSALQDLQRFQEALESYDQALALRPDRADLHSIRGDALMALRQHEAALASYERAIALQPDFGLALLNRGAALIELKRYPEALECLDRGLDRVPDHPDGLMNRGSALSFLHRPVEALTSYDQVIALRPEHHDSHLNRGNAQLDLGRPLEALASYERALILKPDGLGALLNRATALLSLNRVTEALASCDLVLTFQPDCVDGLVNRGTVLLELRRPGDALASYERALALKPDYPTLLMNRGAALHQLGRHSEAIASCDEALALDPDHALAHSNKIFFLDYLPEIGFPEHQQERRAYYLAHAQRFEPQEIPAPSDRTLSRRLVLGYVSADFKHHSAASSFLPVLQRHSKTEFQINCYSGVQVEDDWTQRFRACAEVWRPTAGLSDEALAARIRADGVDILIDLSGHSKGNRLLVFARKPAPIQVTAWGHGGGTGLPAIDYQFTDPVSIPASVRPLFAEEVYDLPCCITFEAPDFSPPVLDLPARSKGFVTFGSLNRFAKVTPAVENLWARILEAVPGSHLMLKDAVFDLPEKRQEVLAAFRRRGIPPERIDLRGFTSHRTHLATYGEVDISLDPFPQNGGITTWESLWMGTPVVAMLGNKFVSRISGAILHALELGAWVAQEEDEYLEVAIHQALDLDALARFRPGIRDRIRSSPAGDPVQYTRRVEMAYRAMWGRWLAGRS
jgi:predicted O-linked N-acetylglucosamine transferase (SPINDLY family)